MEQLFPFLFLGAALYLLWRLFLLKRYGVTVQVKVTKQKIDWGPNTTASPMFEIVSGEYRGETAKSMFGTSFGFHSVGSIHEGLYHPNLGMIESKTTFGVLKFFTFLFLFGSVAFLIWRYAIPLFTT